MDSSCVPLIYTTCPVTFLSHELWDLFLLCSTYHGCKVGMHAGLGMSISESPRHLSERLLTIVFPSLPSLRRRRPITSPTAQLVRPESA